MSQNFIKVYKYLVVGTFALIALGGSVRVMNAGLACPDWPLCFGEVIPDYHPEVYFEFLHRALAGFIGLVTVVLHTMILRNKNVNGWLKVIASGSLVLLAAQVIMGGLTVLLQLQGEVVTTHLALGTSYFASLLWIYLSLRDGDRLKTFKLPQWMPRYAKLTALCVFAQILLGGFVASHYAALVCVDFPTCHGKIIPTLYGIIGLQVVHRLGAYLLTIIVVSFSVLVLRNTEDNYLRNKAWLLIAMIFVQVALGISNILLMTPPVIAVAHLAVGVALLATSLSSVRRITLVHQVDYQDVPVQKHPSLRTALQEP